MRTGTMMTLMLLAGLTACSEDSPPAATQNTAPAPATAKPAVAETTIIATGADIAGANGLHFGPDGLLYAVSVIGSEMLALDPDSADIRKRWTDSDGVFGPDDVAFNASGDVYWTSILTGEVAGFTADGERVVAANLGPGVNPITFSDDGRLFVAQCFFDTGLYEVDPAGIDPPRSIRDDLGPGCGLNGMDWGPDGRLYGPRWFEGSVVSIDVDSGEMRDEVSGLDVPAAVKFDSQGRLHVLDTGAGKVQRVTDSGLETVALLPPGLDNFAFDSNDRLFVSSFTDGFVARIDDGQPVYLLPGGMAHPGGVAVHGDQVVVADFHSLRGYAPDTGTELFVQRNVLGVSELGSIVAVADDGEHLLLTSWMDNNVRVWDPETQQTLARYEDLPLPIQAIRFNGRIAVTLHGTGAVALIDDSSEVVELATGFTAPTGIAAAGDSLLVTDRAAGSVSRVTLQGEVEVLASGLNAPEGIATIGQRIFVQEGETGQIREVTDGGSVVIAELAFGGGPPASDTQPPSMIFNGLATDGNALFATDERQRALYRIDL